MSDLGLEPDRHFACPSLGISAEDLQVQLRAAGFVQCACESRTFLDVFPTGDAFVAWARSSAFGNFLVNVSAADHIRVRQAISRLLMPKLTSEGICLKRHVTFSTARKPA